MIDSVARHILALHGIAALAIVFAVPLLESSAFVGFVFPGEIAVLLGGVLASQHEVRLPVVLAAAIAGAVIGDTIGYEVGRRLGRRLLDHPRLGQLRRRHRDRAEAYMRQRGAKIVLLGRFTAALRALIPGLAGMSGMSYPRFAVYNAVGGVVWATTVAVVGYAAGTNWRHVEALARRTSVLLLIPVGLLVMVGVARRYMAQSPERLPAAEAKRY
jgi:undecaprenyl-diphosphatase